jgi:hypothetical protein
VADATGSAGGAMSTTPTDNGAAATSPTQRPADRALPARKPGVPLDNMQFCNPHPAPANICDEFHSPGTGEFRVFNYARHRGPAPLGSGPCPPFTPPRWY